MSIEAVSLQALETENNTQNLGVLDAASGVNFGDELAAAMAADHATLEQVTYTALLNPMATSIDCDGICYGVSDVINLSRSVNGSQLDGGMQPREKDMQRGMSEGIIYNGFGEPLSWPQNDWHPANRGMDHYDIMGGAARVYDFSQSDWDTIAHHRRHNGAWLERFGYGVTEVGEDKLLVTKSQVSAATALDDASSVVDRRPAQASENVSAYDPPDGPRFLRFY